MRAHFSIPFQVPQFSFSRLVGADVMLGVEMASTGEEETVRSPQSSVLSFWRLV